MNKGYVHVYTGNGKGKTTAAIGLMIRAVGAGKRVYFGQFMKQGDYSEIKILTERFPEITVVQYGGRLLLGAAAESADVRQARQGLTEAAEALHSGQYDLVVLDEINVAAFLELLDIDQVAELVSNRPAETELVLTGRYADKKIIDMADLVSEITQVKHYFNDGVAARPGIEM